MSATIHDRIAWWLRIGWSRRTLIAASILVGTVVSAFVAISSGPRYEATAGVAILQTRLLTTLELSASSERAEDVQTALLAAPQSALQGSPQLAASYLAARRGTLVALVENQSIAESVLERLGGDARPEELAPGALVAEVHGRLKMGEDDEREFTNIIEISVRGADPTRAALIADLWATEYVRLVNQRLGQGADLPALQQALEGARLDLDASEQALAGFVTASRLDELTRRRAEALSSIELLQRARAARMAGSVEHLDPRALVEELGRRLAADEPLSAAIAAHEAKVRELTASIEREEATRRRLLATRDRAQAFHARVAVRVEKLSAASETSNEEVRIVAKAAVPADPIPPTPAQTVGLGAMAGLLLGLALVYVLAVLRGGPPVHTAPLGAAEDVAARVEVPAGQPA